MRRRCAGSSSRTRRRAGPAAPFALAIALPLVVALGGCPSFDNFTGGDAAALTSVTDGGAADGADAADAIGTSPDGARITTCGAEGLVICEDFENGPTGRWTTETATGASAVADATRAYRGTKALHLRTADQRANGSEPQRAAIQASGTPLPSSFHLRFFAFLASPPSTDANDAIIATIVHNGGAFPGLDLAAKYVSGGRRVGIDAWADNLHVTSSRGFPLDAWTCIEWAVTPNGVNVFVDRQDVAELARAVAVPSIDQLTVGVAFGNGNALPAFAPYEAWIDELLLGTAPIGCDTFVVTAP